MVSSHHKRNLVKAIILVRAITWTILILSSLLPSFDSSAALVLDNPFFSFLLRWDAFHFAHIAKEGYVYEHEFAFFPGTPLLMQTFSRVMHLIGLSQENGYEGFLVAGALVAGLASDATTIILYDLTAKAFESPSFAYLCSLLYLLSPSPATLRNAPYTEPFFAFFSYQGLLFCAENRWLFASIAFSLSSLFRSNGVMLCGFLVWGMLIQPWLQSVSKQKSPKKPHFPIFTAIHCALLCVLPFLAFGGFQYFAYQSFCSPVPTRPWCTRTPPLVYTFVQAEYWNSGFLKYWTFSQIPNFILAAPVIALLIATSTQHIRSTVVPQLQAFLFDRSTGSSHNVEPILRPVVAPHAIHALLLSVTLLTSAHVQIALRLVSSMPFTYWAAGNLWVRSSGGEPGERSYAQWWTTWSVVWGAISLVLWGVFLPPA